MQKPTIEALRRSLAGELHRLSDQPSFEARQLLIAALNESLETILLEGDRELTNSEITIIEALKKRRLSGEPLAYVIGQWQFYSLDIKVNKHTLIPRPETELLVDFCLKQSLAPSPRVIDLGTGSGAIALALQHERPHWRVTATDLSPSALEVATENAERHNLQSIQFVRSRWWDEFAEEPRFDLVISNPPYIAVNDAAVDLNVVAFEPERALFAEKNGLADIEVVIIGAVKRMNNEGLLVIEHGYQQGELVRELMQQNGFKDSTTLKDIHNHERFTYARLNVA